MSVDQEINVTIDSFPEGEKSFVEIPFEVAQDIERIEIAYHFPFGGGGSVIDLGVARNGRMRGWSGSERGFITIEEDRRRLVTIADPCPARGMCSRNREDRPCLQGRS